MKKIILLFLFIFIFLKLGKAEDITLTLDEAIAIALRDNPEILLNKEEINKAKELLGQAYAAVFPRLNISGSWQRSLEFYNKDISSINTQVNLQQPLYQGGRIINTISINKDRIELSKVILDKTKLEIVSQVKKAFYSLLLSEKLLELNQKILENIQNHLSVLKERYQYGQASKNDILNMETSLISIQKLCEEALIQKQQTQEILKNLLSLDKDVIIKPNAEFFYEEKEIVYDSAFLEALSKRPEIKQYELEENIARKNIELAHAENRPQIFSFWNYYSNSRTNLGFSTTKGWQDNQILGVTVNWPVFDGWFTSHKIKESIIELKQIQILKEKINKDIILELKRAYFALKNAIAKLKKTESEILFYKDNLLTLEEKYKKGEVSSLDKEDAELKYRIAIFNREEAIYDYLISKIDFDKATGEM